MHRECANRKQSCFFGLKLHFPCDCSHLDSKLSHGVVIYGEYTYHKKFVFHLSALKPEAEMVSEAFRGCYDFDKPENISPLSAIKSDKLKT